MHTACSYFFPQPHSTVTGLYLHVFFEAVHTVRLVSRHVCLPTVNAHFSVNYNNNNNNNNNNNLSVMDLGHLLTRSGITYPEVSSKVCHDSFCQLENSVMIFENTLLNTKCVLNFSTTFV